MNEAEAQPKATLTNLSADLIGNAVQAGVSLSSGGTVTFYLTGVDAEKAREAVKQAMQDAASAL